MLYQIDSLACMLEILPIPADQWSLRFRLQNRGANPVQLDYFAPFISFDLSAVCNQDPISIRQPALNVAGQPTRLSVPSGQERTLMTPIQICFDPGLAPASKDDPFLWSLCHAPAAVTLRAVLTLNDHRLPPCETFLDPASHAEVIR